MADVRKVARDAWPATRVSDIMTAAPDVAVVSPDETAVGRAAEARGSATSSNCLSSTARRLVGLLRRGDILRWLELQPRGRGARIAGERHA